MCTYYIICAVYLLLLFLYQRLTKDASLVLRIAFNVAVQLVCWDFEAEMLHLTSCKASIVNVFSQYWEKQRTTAASCPQKPQEKTEKKKRSTDASEPAVFIKSGWDTGGRYRGGRWFCFTLTGFGKSLITGAVYKIMSQLDVVALHVHQNNLHIFSDHHCLVDNVRRRSEDTILTSLLVFLLYYFVFL